MKRLVLAALLTAAGYQAAVAAECNAELASLDAQIAATSVTSELKAQLADMRNQAQNLCSAGNGKESLDVIAEARALLETK